MTCIVVVGPDAALLEGLSQTLVGAGHQVLVTKDIPEALEHLRGARPLAAVVHRDALIDGGAVFRIPLAHGGALVAFHSDDSDPTPLPFGLQRATLADLVLPLERQRLLALLRFVAARAEVAGREPTFDSEDSADRPA